MEYTIRPYRKHEEQYAADLHRRLYTEEYRWGNAFTDYAAKIALDFAGKEKNSREELFIAETDHKPVGCIMLCTADDPDTGQLRLFAVEKEYRKYGIGSALLAACMDKAKQADYRKMILWTADPLLDAIRLYERLGFRTVETVENHTWRTDGTAVYEIKMETEMKK